MQAPFKKGIAYLLKQNPHIPYVPVFMQGLGYCLPKGSRVLLPLGGLVRIGAARFCRARHIADILQEVEWAIRRLAPRPQASTAAYRAIPPVNLPLLPSSALGSKYQPQYKLRENQWF